MKSDFLYCIEDYFTKHGDWHDAIDAIISDVNGCINTHGKIPEDKQKNWVISGEKNKIIKLLGDALESHGINYK